MRTGRGVREGHVLGKLWRAKMLEALAEEATAAMAAAGVRAKRMVASKGRVAGEGEEERVQRAKGAKKLEKELLGKAVGEDETVYIGRGRVPWNNLGKRSCCDFY